MTFPLYNELVPASTVSHAVWAHLVPECAHFPYLVTVRNGSMDVYEVSQDIAEFQGAPLQLITSSALQDDITDIKPIRFTGSLLKKLMNQDTSVASIDVLMLCFPGGKISIVALDPFTLTFKTIAMLNFQPDGLNPGAVVFPADARIVPWGASARGNIAVDPDGQCACISPAADVLAIIPVRKDIEGLSIFSEGEMSAGWSGTASDLPIFSAPNVSNESKVIDEQDMLSAQFLRKPYLIHMADIPGAPDGSSDSGCTGYEGGNGIADMAFLNSGGVSSTLAVLVHSRNTSTTRSSSLLHTSSIVVLNVDTGGYTSAKPSVLWKKDGLPHDAFAVVPVSNIIGGVLVISPSSVLYFNETEYYGLAVNGFAAYTVNCLYQYKLNTNADVKVGVPPACVDLTQCRVTPLTPDAFLVVTMTGYAHLLRLHVDANAVRGMTLHPADSILGSAPTALVVPLVNNRRLIQQYIIRLQQRSSRNHSGTASSDVLPDATALLNDEVSDAHEEDTVLHCGLFFMASLQTRPMLFSWWLETTDDKANTATSREKQDSPPTIPALTGGTEDGHSPETMDKLDSEQGTGVVAAKPSPQAITDDDADLYSVTPSTVPAVPVTKSDAAPDSSTSSSSGNADDLDDLYSVPVKDSTADTASASPTTPSATEDSLYAVSATATATEMEVDTIFSTNNLSLRLAPVDSLPALTAASAATIGKRKFVPQSPGGSAKYHASDTEYVVATGQYGNGGVSVVRSTVPYEIVDVMEFEGCFHSWHVPLTSPAQDDEGDGEDSDTEDSSVTGYFFFAMRDNTTRVLEIGDGLSELGSGANNEEKDSAEGGDTEVKDGDAGGSVVAGTSHFIMDEITLFACALPGNRIFQLTQSYYVVVEYSVEDKSLRRLFDPVPIESIYSSYSTFDMGSDEDRTGTSTATANVDEEMNTSTSTPVPSLPPVSPHTIHIAAVRDLNGLVVVQDTHGRLFYADFCSNPNNAIGDDPSKLFDPLLLTPGHPVTAFYLGNDHEPSDTKKHHSLYPSIYTKAKSPLPYLLVARRCGTVEFYDLRSSSDVSSSSQGNHNNTDADEDVSDLLPTVVWTLKAVNLHPRILIPTASQTDLSATFFDAYHARTQTQTQRGASTKTDTPTTPVSVKSEVDRPGSPQVSVTTATPITKRSRATSVSSIPGVTSKLARTDSHTSQRSQTSYSSASSVVSVASVQSASVSQVTGDADTAEAADALMDCMDEEGVGSEVLSESPISSFQPRILDYSAPTSPVPATYVTDLTVLTQRGGKKILVMVMNTQQLFSYAWTPAGAKYSTIVSDIQDLVGRENKSYIFPSLSKVSRFIQIPSATLLAKTLDNSTPTADKGASVAIPFPPFQPYLASQFGSSFVQYPPESWTRPLVQSPYKQAMLRPFTSLSGWSGCFLASKLPHLLLAYRGSLHALPLAMPVGRDDHFPKATPQQATLQLLGKDPLHAFTPFISKFLPEGVLLTQESTTTIVTLNTSQWNSAPMSSPNAPIDMDAGVVAFRADRIPRPRVLPLGLAICAYTAKPLSLPPSHVVSRVIGFLLAKGNVPVPSVYDLPPYSNGDNDQATQTEVHTTTQSTDDADADEDMKTNDVRDEADEESDLALVDQTWQPLEEVEQGSQVYGMSVFDLLTTPHTEFGTYACMYYPMHRGIKHICYLDYTSAQFGQSYLQAIGELEEQGDLDDDGLASPSVFTSAQQSNANYPLYVATLMTPTVRNYDQEVEDLHSLLESLGGEYVQYNYGEHIDWAKLPLEDARVDNSFDMYGSSTGIDAVRGKSMWNNVVETFRRGGIDTAPPVLGTSHSIALIHGSGDGSEPNWHLLDHVELQSYEKITCMQEMALGVGNEGEFMHVIAVGTSFQTYRGEGGRPEGRLLLFEVTRVVAGDAETAAEQMDAEQTSDIAESGNYNPIKTDTSSVDNNNPSVPEVSPVSNSADSTGDVQATTGDPVTSPETDENDVVSPKIDIEDDVQATHRVATVPKLRLIQAEPISRAYVLAMTPLSVINENGDNERHLVVSIGRRIQIYGWQASHSRVRMIGFYDLFTSITSLATAKEFIIAGDAHNSITFLRWRNPDKQLLFLASDPLPLPIASVGAVVHTNRLDIYAADVEGNTTLYKYDPLHGGSDLLTSMDIHTGHMASTAALTHVPITISVPTLLSGRSITSITAAQSAFRQAVMSANTDGCVALMQPLLESDYKRLLALQRLILLSFPQVAGVNPRLSKMFESLSQPFRDTVSRKQGILYLPILLTFLNLSAIVQGHLCDAIGSSTERVLLTLRNLYAEATFF